MTHIPNNNTESLPKQFVSAMRTLFDIMDDKRTGYVRLTDIENRWRDDRTKGLPRGVIESLQKNQVDKVSNNVEQYDPPVEQNHIQMKISKRPPSAPLLDTEETHCHDNKWNIVKTTEPAQQRTSSMPQLVARKELPGHEMSNLMPTGSNHEVPVRLFGPPKPPRLEKLTERKESKILYKTDDDDGNFQIDHSDIKKYDPIGPIGEFGRGLGDGRPAGDLPQQTTLRRGNRRREPRRHTLHNGVDYNLLKRMKQIEQEKDVLMEGLTAVEEAREWYLKQLAEVQEKIRYAGRMGTYVEPWSEAQQERIELLRARVLELNRQLGALAAGWRRGPLSLHMNLAVPMTPSESQPNILRSQNKMLSEEVNRKNEKISALEREKSALIRELLLQRSRSKMLENFN